MKSLVVDSEDFGSKRPISCLTSDNHRGSELPRSDRSSLVSNGNIYYGNARPNGQTVIPVGYRAGKTRRVAGRFPEGGCCAEDSPGEDLPGKTGSGCSSDRGT